MVHVGTRSEAEACDHVLRFALAFHVRGRLHRRTRRGPLRDPQPIVRRVREPTEREREGESLARGRAREGKARAVGFRFLKF